MKYKTKESPSRQLSKAIGEYKTLSRKKEKKTGAEKKKLKALRNRIPQLKRLVYIEKMERERKQAKKTEKRLEKVVLHLEEKEMETLLEKDIEYRKTKAKNSLTIEKEAFEDKRACQACNQPLRDVYGVIRCGCN